MKANLPRITIITPTLNQAPFLEQTICSVVEQGYPNLEYLIFDGGSTDGSVEIIIKYAEKYPQTIKWQSQKDNGQVNAINKGLKQATGEIIAFINSDDYYLPNCFQTVAKSFSENPDKVWLTGLIKFESWPKTFFTILPRLNHFFLLSLYKLNRSFQLVFNCVAQPGTFWKKEATKKIGLLEERFVFAFDYEYWLRLQKLTSPIIIKKPLAVFRFHPRAKGSIFFKKQFQEEFLIAKTYCSSKPLLFFHWLFIHGIILPALSIFNAFLK